MIRPPRGPVPHHPKRRLRAQERAGEVGVHDRAASRSSASVLERRRRRRTCPALLNSRSTPAERSLDRVEQRRDRAGSATSVGHGERRAPSARPPRVAPAAPRGGPPAPRASRPPSSALATAAADPRPRAGDDRDAIVHLGLRALKEVEEHRRQRSAASIGGSGRSPRTSRSGRGRRPRGSARARRGSGRPSAGAGTLLARPARARDRALPSVPISHGEPSATTTSSVPWVHRIGGLGSRSTIPAQLQYLGDSALRIPRVPGATPGQCSDGVASPG